MAQKKRKSKPTTDSPAYVESIKSPLRKNLHNITLFSILSASVILRVLYFIQNSSENPLFNQPVSDAEVYFKWAQEIAAGTLLKNSVFYMAPLYPYLLAGIFKVFGESISAVVVVQHAIGVVNLYLIYRVSGKVFGDKIGLLAVALAALHAPFVFYESKILLPTFTIFFYLLSLLLLLHQNPQKPNNALTFVTGLVMGVAIVHRANILLFIPLMLFWFFLIYKPDTKRAIASAILILTGIAVPVLPITIHNYKASGDFIPLTSNTGINFYYGANINAAPTFTRRETVSDSIEKEEEKAKEIAEEALGRELGPSEVSKYWMGKGFSVIADDFPTWLLYEVKKLYWIINTYEIPNNYNLPFEKKNVPMLNLFFIPYGFICLLSILGIILANKKDKGVQLLLFYLISLFMGLMIFTVVSRFRVPLTVVMCSFAAYGLIEYFKLMRERNHNLQASKKYLAVTIILIVLAVPTLVPYRKATNPASTYHTLGVLAYRDGKYDEAIKYHELAIQTYPMYTEAYNNMGSAYMKKGDNDKALEMFDKASEQNPDYAESRFNAGLVFMERKDYKNAIDRFEQALAIHPAYVKAKMNLSFAQFRSGMQLDAIRTTRELIQIDPGAAQHYYNLGLMLSQVGSNDEAIEMFILALEKDPDYTAAREALEKLK